MKRWQWWAVGLAALLIVAAVFVVTRYSMQCVVLPGSSIAGPGASPGSASVCYVLDRWTGTVHRAETR